jgi:hypothetical protein
LIFLFGFGYQFANQIDNTEEHLIDSSARTGRDLEKRHIVPRLELPQPLLIEVPKSDCEVRLQILFVAA